MNLEWTVGNKRDVLRSTKKEYAELTGSGQKIASRDTEEKWKKPQSWSQNITLTSIDTEEEGRPDLVISVELLEPTLIDGRPQLGRPRDDQPLIEATSSKCRLTSSDPGSPLF